MRQLEYPFTEPPEFGASLEVMPGIHWLRMPLPMSLDHINLYLVDAGAGWYIIDTGLRGDAVQAHWQKIFANCLQGRPVLGIFVTHMHPDHVGQAGWLEEYWQAPVFMTLGEYYSARAIYAGLGAAVPRLAEQYYRRTGFDSVAIEKIREGARGFSRVIEPLPGAFLRVREDEVLQWGDRRMRVVVGQGHSPEHACLVDEANGVMFSGDQIIASITSNVSVMAIEPEANPLALWLESHHKMMSLPADILVLPAHGLPFRGVRTRLQQLIDHHEDHLQALEEACLQPRTAMSLLPVLFRRKLDEQDTLLALGECIAHLHLMLDRGTLERLLVDDIYHYRTLDTSVALRVGKVQHLQDDDPIQV
jgi:glyoxylase-like metal-dependent hydrolase (beta-lactamase superfamily II)